MADMINGQYIPIKYLNLSSRCYNCLRKNGIGSVKEFLQLTEPQLNRMRNMGEKSIAEVLKKQEELRPFNNWYTYLKHSREMSHQSQDEEILKTPQKLDTVFDYLFALHPEIIDQKKVKFCHPIHRSVVYELRIKDLNLSSRVREALLDDRIKYVSQLKVTPYQELVTFYQLGLNSLDELIKSIYDVCYFYNERMRKSSHDFSSTADILKRLFERNEKREVPTSKSMTVYDYLNHSDNNHLTFLHPIHHLVVNDLSIKDLNLSRSVTNALLLDGIERVSQLKTISYVNLSEFYALGSRALDEVVENLKKVSDTSVLDEYRHEFNNESIDQLIDTMIEDIKFYYPASHDCDEILKYNLNQLVHQYYPETEINLNRISADLFALIEGIK